MIRKVNIHGWLRTVNDNFNLLKGFSAADLDWARYALPAGNLT